MCSSWLIPVLPDALRHIFQRCILEHDPQIQELISSVIYLKVSLMIWY